MEIPSKIGKYKIIKDLGEGASGRVVKAEQEVIGRVVALKILFSHLLKDKPVLVKRFKREARLASSLIHPHIVPIFEIGEENGVHYYTMQYIEGIPMTEYIKNDILELKVKLDIFIELCDALALAHSRNIVHRDLKPHNVIITKELHPTILDFGIAKSLMEDDHMTQVGHILGSAHYMAPEPATSGAIGTYTDVFAIGVMIYEMMAGQRPFEGGNVKELIIQRIEYGKHPEAYRPPCLQTIKPDIPKKLDEIVFRSLDADSKKRYQTAGELLIDLQCLKREFIISDSLKRQRQEIISPFIHKKRSYFYPALLALTIFLLFTGISTWVYLSNKPYLSWLKKIQSKGYELLKMHLPK
jgi:serine/threonine-protein kinase